MVILCTSVGDLYIEPPLTNTRYFSSSFRSFDCVSVQCSVIAAFTITLLITLVVWRRSAWNAFVSGNSRRHTGNGSRGPEFKNTV